MKTESGRNPRSQSSLAHRSDAGMLGIIAAEDHRTDRWSSDTSCEESGELERRVKNFLAGRSIPSLRRLTVEVDGTSVQLRGMVRSYYEKQLAVHCCQRVAGVINVIDAIQVSDSD